MSPVAWRTAGLALQRQILDATLDLVSVRNRSSRLVWANRAFLDFHGMNLEEARRRLPPGDDADEWSQREARASEAPLVRHDGQTRWFHTVKTPIFDADDKPALLLEIARDVTDTRSAGTSLDRINACLIGLGTDSLENIDRLTGLCGELLGADIALYSRFENGLLSSIGQWNVPGDFNPVNPAQDSLCAEIISRATDEPVAVCELQRSPYARKDPRIKLYGISTYVGIAVKDNERVIGCLCALFRRDKSIDAVVAKVMGIISSAIAVEEERLRGEKARSRLAEELRQAQKMEAVGRLAGGIAHDFNNTLTAIKGYAEMLQLTAPAPAQKNDAAEILRSVDYAASLTRQLLAFGRRQMLIPRVVDLNEVLRGTTRMLKRLIRENVELNVEPCAGQALVYADPGQLEQVVLNLALNARDAMPDGGRLSVTTAEAAESEVPASEDGKPASGRYIALTVSDTGVGISPEIQPHIFEPFFTTKEQGKGTGLGLATVYGIVTQSGGRITCESVPGKGTAFRVYLPCCEGPLEPTPAAETVADLQGKGLVLLVEDDAAIRTMFARVLKSAGYDVLEAAAAEHALQLVEKSSRAPDVLVTDVVMPGINGRQLAMQLERARTGAKLKVLYMSGYTDDAAFRNALGPGTAFLQKPFNPSDLCRRLKELLAS